MRQGKRGGAVRIRSIIPLCISRMWMWTLSWSYRGKGEQGGVGLEWLEGVWGRGARSEWKSARPCVWSGWVGVVVPVGVAVGAKVFPSIVGARVVGDAVGGTVAQVTLSRSVPVWELLKKRTVTGRLPAVACAAAATTTRSFRPPVPQLLVPSSYSRPLTLRTVSAVVSQVANITSKLGVTVNVHAAEPPGPTVAETFAPQPITAAGVVGVGVGVDEAAAGAASTMMYAATPMGIVIAWTSWRRWADILKCSGKPLSGFGIVCQHRCVMVGCLDILATWNRRCGHALVAEWEGALTESAVF